MPPFACTSKGSSGALRRSRVTSAAFNSGLWTAWRPDGRLQGSPGSGFCSPSQSAQPLITHSSEHNRGTLYLGPPPSSWDTQGRRKENGGLSVTCAVRWPHPKHSSLFSCPRQLGSVRHECLSSSLMPGGGLLWEQNCYSCKTLFSTSICC